MEFVKIDWVDSRMAFCGWEDNTEAKEFQLANCHSAGFILEENDSEIILVMSYSDDNDTIAGKAVIPKSCIKSITRDNHTIDLPDNLGDGAEWL